MTTDVLTAAAVRGYTLYIMKTTRSFFFAFNFTGPRSTGRGRARVHP
jgi:L-rhamnose mutarotase